MHSNLWQFIGVQIEVVFTCKQQGDVLKDERWVLQVAPESVVIGHEVAHCDHVS